MASKEISTPRKILYSGIILFVLLVILSLLGEGVMRLRQKPLPAPYDNKEKDAELGWKSKPYYQYYTDSFVDARGKRYPVSLNFVQHGFRQWNTSAYDSTVGTVFFIGDSYTESVECSDSLTFYSMFKDSVPVNIYASGTAGYGTVQEMLVLDKYIDTVKPKWIVLETCMNDFIDNYWMMEMLSGYHVGEERPYLVDGKIEYHYPRPWYEKVKDYSLFANWVLDRSRQALLNLRLRHRYMSTEEMVEMEGKNYPPYATSLQMTEQALLRMKQTADSHNAKLLVYIFGRTGGKNEQMNDMVDICRRNNIATITGAIEKAEEAEVKGAVLRSFDGYHFNPKGQKILGNVLIDYFRAHELSEPGK